MATWSFGLCDLDGIPIGELTRAYERKLTLTLNGLPTASFRLRIDDPMADELNSRNGDCLLKVYQDSTLRFIGEVMDMDEVGVGGFYRKVTDRKGLVNVSYVLPTDFVPGTTPEGEIRTKTDFTSIADRGAMQEVIPSDIQDTQLRQALADAHVSVRKQPRLEINFDPSTTGDEVGTLAVNCAGPMWRLSKRLIGTPYPHAASSYSDTPANEIIDALINQANINSDTGIQLGTRDTLYATNVGTDPSWAFKPLSEGLTEMQDAKVAFPVDTPGTYIGVDTFGSPPASHTAMTGQVDDQGNTWAAVGDAEDWHIDGSLGYGYRGATPQISAFDASAFRGRWMISGAANSTAVVSGADYRMGPVFASGNHLFFGPFARHNGASPETGSNGDDAWLWAYASLQANEIILAKKLANQAPVALGTYAFAAGGLGGGTTFRLRLLVDADGNYTVWHYAAGEPLDEPKIIGSDADLATGGALASGKVGFHGSITNWTAAVNIDVDTFLAATYTGAQSFDFEFAPIEPAGGPPPKIANLNVRTQIGTSKPEVIFEPGKTPVFGTDFIVGDYVTGRAKNSDGTSAFNALFRVYGVEINIDEQGKETLTPILRATT